MDERTLDFLEDVGIDLRFLSDMLGPTAVLNYPKVRIAGPFIRKLTVDRVLLEAWKSARFSGEPNIISYSMNQVKNQYGLNKWEGKYKERIIDLDNEPGTEAGKLGRLMQSVPPDKELVFTCSGGGVYQGSGYAELTICLKDGKFDFRPAVIKANSFLEAYEAAKRNEPPLARLVPLTNFLNETCVYVFGEPINRRDVIKYVCNKLGVVHFDKPSEKQMKYRFLGLFENLVKTGIFSRRMTFTYFQFLSIGQSIIISEDIKRLSLRLEELLRARNTYG